MVNKNFNVLFNKAIETYNTYNVGVYAPNDKRSWHVKRNHCIKNELYDVDNTDCGFWFIHPEIISNLQKIDYTVTKMGWGIDTITIEESKRKGFLIIRDYSVETDQLDHTCGYSTHEAFDGLKKICELYELYKLNDN